MAETLTSLLQLRATTQAERVAYRYCAQPDAAEESLTYGELHAAAWRIADALVKEGATGKRVALFDASGLDFVCAFFGILYAGATAVPLAPPHPTRPAEKLSQILGDAAPGWCLASPAMAQRIRQLQGSLDALAAMRVLACPELEKPVEPPDAPADLLALTAVSHVAGADDIAIIQYTSGSTSAPKGVRVSHRNFIENAARVGARMAVGERTTAVSWLPLYHDMGLMNGVVLPLVGGYPAVLMPPAGFSARPLDWLRALTRFRATMTGAPNFAYQACVDKGAGVALDGIDLSALEVAFCGAEPIRAETLEAFCTAFAPAGLRRTALFPCYGLAEATLFVAGGPAGEGVRLIRVARNTLEKQARAADPGDGEEVRTLVCCGRPAGDQRVIIVDPVERRALDERQVGEIWVQGPSVAHGYLHRAEESRAVFDGSLADQPDEGAFLRTGDLGFLVDGELVVTGRRKDLIIIRGENHYPQDIELSVERSHPALRPHAGAAVPITHEGGAESLLVIQEISRAWRGGTDEIFGAICTAVAEQHGIAPSSIALIRRGTIARTTSGKIQRAAARNAFLHGTLDVVAQWHAAAPAAEASGALDLTGETHAQLARLWARILGAGPIDDNSHFFALGGDSLKVVELNAHVASRWGIELDVDQVFRTPTFAQFAAHLGDLVERSAALRRPGERDANATAEHVAAVRSAPVELAQLSPLQSGIWLSEQADNVGAAYHIGIALTLTGVLDVERLSLAITSVLQRHDVLRVRFATRDGIVFQDVGAPFDASLTAIESCAADIGAQCEAFARQPFNLSNDPPCRFRLWRLGTHSHRLGMVVHHLVADGWSVRQLIGEIGQRYAAGGDRDADAADPSASLARVPQYLDQIDSLPAAAGNTSADLCDYWRRTLADMPERIALPTDGVLGEPRSTRGDTLEIEIAPTRLAGLRALARAEGVTLYMLLLASFQLLLSRWSGQDDIVVASPFAVRPTLEAQRTIGLFANMVLLRADLSGNPGFGTLLARIRKAVLGAQRAASVPFTQLVAELGLGRGPTSRRMFQIEFILQPALAPFVPVAGLHVAPRLIPTHTTRFDLTLALFEESDRVSGTLNFACDAFAPATVATLLRQWHALLDAVVAAPQARLSELPLTTADERADIVRRWSVSAARPGVAASLYELFEAQAQRTPDATAVVHGASQLTYRELSEDVRRIGRRLRSVGVGPEEIVGLCIERSPQMIAGLIGILAAGGAYLPLEPDLPPQRLEFMLHDAGVRRVLVGPSTLQRMQQFEVETIDVELAPSEPMADGELATRARVNGENLAYVIYTSGSTGAPKGVAGRHAGVVNYLRFIVEHYGIGRDDIVLNVSSPGFDASLRDIFGPLSCGATLVLASGSEPRNPAVYRAELARWGVTRLLSITPSFLGALCDVADQTAPMLRTILCSGEVLDRELCARARASFGEQVQIFNQYGPTECTMTTTWSDTSAARGDRLPAGRPLPNTFALVLDETMQPLPPYVPGELYIGGAGVTRGYVGRPDLSAECFVPNPLGNGDRLYRTGDMARWRSDGQLDYLGRRDFQVKIRGARVELGEIEAALLRDPDVRQAAVIAHATQGQSKNGELVLTAYLSAVRGSLDPVCLRRHLRALLPEYAVPTGFVQLPELPMTLSGKLDRRALAEVDAPLLRAVRVAPETPVELQLTELLSELLGDSQLGMTDNFFTLGGHSLLAMRVIARIRDLFGVDMPIREFFDAATLRDVVKRIEALRRAGQHVAFDNRTADLSEVGR